MRSISNMASFAGSGQSTQEAFLHTPIPACSAAPVPSSPGHPAAVCPCRGARRGARRGWWPWGPSRAPGSGWGGHRTPACFTGRIWGVPEAVGRGTPAPGSPRASFAAWACGERVPTMGTRTSPLPTALARAQVPCSAPARWRGREGRCGLSRAQTREVSGEGASGGAGARPPPTSVGAMRPRSRDSAQGGRFGCAWVLLLAWHPLAQAGTELRGGGQGCWPQGP